MKKVKTGFSQITVPNSTRVSSWGPYDTTTINRDITAAMGALFDRVQSHCKTSYDYILKTKIVFKWFYCDNTAGAKMMYSDSTIL